ncbi:MAG TPA: sigma-70 family RNA polymerase sigma factor [Opitutaceae bacterium]
MTALSDRERLLRYTRHADQRAFTDLVQRHVDLVYASALRHLHGDRHRAEDVTQEVFTLLARKASGLAQHPSLAGWLYATARLSALDTLRREHRRLHRETKAEAMSLSDSSSPQPHWETVRPVLDDALQDLDERERLPVILRFFGQQSFSAIGQQLGLSENAAQKRVDRALDLLNSALAKRGIASTAALLGASLSHAATTAPAALATTVSTAALATAAAPTAAGLFGLSIFATKTIAAGLAATAVAAAAVFTWQHSHTLPSQPSATIAAAAPAPAAAPIATPTPPTTTAPAAAPAASPASTEPARLPPQILYMIQRGDTEWKIAKQWNVTLTSLRASNPVYDFSPSIMRVGDQVVIPPEGYVDGSPPPTPGYVVTSGDSLPKIGAKTGVSNEQLRAANPGVNWARLRVGQRLQLP